MTICYFHVLQVATIRSGQKPCGHYLAEVCISWLCVVYFIAMHECWHGIIIIGPLSFHFIGVNIIYHHADSGESCASSCVLVIL